MHPGEHGILFVSTFLSAVPGFANLHVAGCNHFDA